MIKDFFLSPWFNFRLHAKTIVLKNRQVAAYKELLETQLELNKHLLKLCRALAEHDPNAKEIISGFSKEVNEILYERK